MTGGRSTENTYVSPILPVTADVLALKLYACAPGMQSRKVLCAVSCSGSAHELTANLQMITLKSK